MTYEVWERLPPLTRTTTATQFESKELTGATWKAEADAITEARERILNFMIFDVSDEEDKTVVMMNYERCRWMISQFAVCCRRFPLQNFRDEIDDWRTFPIARELVYHICRQHEYFPITATIYLLLNLGAKFEAKVKCETSN